MTTNEFSTCGLGDEYKNDSSGGFRVLPPVFRDFGQRRKFAGTVDMPRRDDQAEIGMP